MYDIFKYFLQRDTDSEEDIRKRRGYLTLFVNKFPISEFTKEDKVVMDILNKAVKLKAPLKMRFIEVYMKSDLKVFIAKNRIAIPQTETFMLDDISQLGEAASIIGTSILDRFEDMEEEEANIEDFVIDLKEWIDIQKEASIKRLLQESSKRLHALSKKEIGPDDVLKLIQKESNRIALLYTDKTVSDLIGRVKSNTYEVVFKSGLKPINDGIPGIYTGELLTVAAGPGVGKTSLTFCDIIYTSIVELKKNIMAFCLEQKEDYIRALLVARHCVTLFRKTLSANSIAKELYTDPEILKNIEIARYDLFESGKYGRLYIHDKTEPFYLEDMTSNFDTAMDLYGPFDGVVLDHAAIIQQRPDAKVHMDIGGIVRTAYLIMVAYLGRGLAGIMVDQLTQEGAELAALGKRLAINSYAGGAEPLRSSDYVLVQEETEQMKANHAGRIYSTKSRISEGVPPFMVQKWLSCGFYKVIADNADLAK